MRDDIKLEMSDQGVPVAWIPAEIAWDLVEHLSNQRVRVLYSFEASRVVVRFNNMSLPAATEVLEVWSNAKRRDEGTLPRHANEARSMAAHA